ncbi:hypothetical protein HOY80DRAFT_1028746 [Tuber brumale]|nr:hypothetical protein HOY80DRAFT_1028746 [Tuber brumale]
MSGLRYRLVSETVAYTIEQLEQVNIRLLKYLTDRTDDPIAIPASEDFPHAAHAGTSDLRESGDEPKISLRQSEGIPIASSSSLASAVSESSVFGGMHGSKATFGCYLK